MKIVFVVLQYKGYYETENCVLSIKKYIDIDDYKIIIVDNCSPDDSFVKIKNKYENDEKILITKTDKNLGFANGNNFGIEIALNKYSPEYVVVLNNDTELMYGPFTSVIEKKYSETGFSILGPMVLSRDGKCDSNPIRYGLQDVDSIRHEIKHFNRHLLINKIGLSKLYNYYMMRKYEHKRRTTESDNKIFKDQTDVRLNGCFLVFSPNYFKYYNGFDTGTFMYFEEAILQLMLRKHNLIGLYTPDIRVFHYECASTFHSFNESKEYVSFRCTNRIKSRMRYLRLLEDMNKNGEN